MALLEGNHSRSRRDGTDSDSDIYIHSNSSWTSVSKIDKPVNEQPDSVSEDIEMTEAERGPLLDYSSGSNSRAEANLYPDDHRDHTLNDATEETKSSLHLILVTICMLGLQMGWSVEMAGVSPFLLSLGLSKALLALVWIAGPLSGTVVQPYVGINSDNSRSRWGRRKPLMVWGAVATIGSLLCLAWTREIIGVAASIFGIELWGQPTSTGYQIWAVAFIYILDFAINVIQAGIRAFIVDCLPMHQQQLGNAWASRIGGFGHILAYIIGFVNLPKILPWLGDSQFKVFVALACITMAVTMAVTSLTVFEPDPRLLGPPPDKGRGVLAFFKSLYHSVRTLPLQVKLICLVQIFAWMGWFPFLFYTSTYIGELYCEPFFEANPNMSDQEINEIWEKATRVGTFALLIFAITTFLSSVFIPMIIPPTYGPHHEIIEYDEFGSPVLVKSDQAWTNRGWKGKIANFFNKPNPLQIPWLSLRRAWMLSHVLYAILMWLTFFVKTPVGGTILIGLVGIPWALTTWAPFALIAAEISARNTARRANRSLRASSSDDPEQSSDSSATQADKDREDESADQAGVLLGIHNVAISAPQVVATLISSAVFQALQKPRGTPGDDSVGWVMRMAGVSALVAAWCTRYVREDNPR